MWFSIPYRDEPFAPRLGATTAKSNFCEEDFVVSAWIAEFANTLTNIAYVLYAIRGLRQSRPGSGSAKAMYAGLALVGVCSALFHGLLKYWSQMSDDQSMIIASATVLQQAMTYGRSERFNKIFTITLTVLVVAETVYHAAMDELVVHEHSFLVLIALVAYRTRQLVKERAGGEADRSRLRTVTWLGTGCMLFGYFLWRMDTRYCSELTDLKRGVGMPWSFAFEFHGWWHILTAVGAYTFMVLVESLTQEEVVVSSRPFGILVRLIQGEKSKQA